MAWRPQLNVICPRCGKRREGIRHVCVVDNSKAARRGGAPELKLGFGKCPTCRKSYGAGGPLTHHCAPKSDFGKRKREHERKQRAAARKKRQAERHDYQACSDRDCPRPLCVAFKTGYKLGHEEGYEQGWIAGYGAGYADGAASARSRAV